MAWHNAMVQGTSISLGRMAIAAATVGGMLLIASATAQGDDRRLPYAVRSGAGALLLIDDCESFTDLPPIHDPPTALRLSAHPAMPATRAIPVVWTESRGPQRPLRGTGSDWIFMPFDGCTGTDTGDFDLRNPSGREAVLSAHTVAIGFRPSDESCAPAAAANAMRPGKTRPGARPPFILP